MDNYLKQINLIWSGLGLGQRISIFVSLLFLGVGLSVLFYWSSKPHMQLLYGRLDSQDIAEVVSVVEEHEIPYRIGAGGATIYVPKDKVYQLRMELATKGIPNGGGVGYEIFDRGNFGISDFVQKTNYIRAIQGELARTISQLHGVKSSRVMVVVPENKILAAQNRSKPTASVFVDTGGGQIPLEAVNSIRFLVSNAVEGLALNDVAVIDNKGSVLSEQVRSDEVLGLASGQLRFRRNVESYFSEKIESMLARVIGPENVVVRVSVDLEQDTSTIFEEKFDPDSQVVRSQSITEDVSNSVESLGKKSSEVVESSSPLSSSQDTRKNKSINYEINRSTLEVVKRPGSVNKVSAAVFIAQQYEEKEDGKVIYKPRSDEEISQIESMVSNALGTGLYGASAGESFISIKEIPFQRSENITENDAFDIPDKVFKWAEVGKNFLSVIIAVIVFFILTRMIKKHRPTNMSIQVGDSFKKDLESRKRESEIEPTPELLNSLIQQKPDNVGTALKNWVSSDVPR